MNKANQILQNRVSGRRVQVGSINQAVQRFNQMINADAQLRREILKPVYDRLKYASGNTVNGISFITELKTRQGSLGEQFISEITVGLISDNQDALLGYSENTSIEIPTVSELVQYINDKRKYFAGGLRAATELNNEIMRRRTQSLRNIFDKKNKVGGFDSSDGAIIEDMAKAIRGRMVRRVLGGHPSTKGSEYVLVGHYKSTMNRGNFKNQNRQFVAPRYIKKNNPLLTLVGGTGELNIVAREALTAYLRTFFEQVPRAVQGKSTSPITQLSSMIGSYMKIREQFSGNKSFQSAEKHVQELTGYMNQLKHQDKSVSLAKVKEFRDIQIMIQMGVADSEIKYIMSLYKSQIKSMMGTKERVGARFKRALKRIKPKG